MEEGFIFKLILAFIFILAIVLLGAYMMGNYQTGLFAGYLSGKILNNFFKEE